MEAMFPVELTLRDASASCFLSLGDSRIVQWWYGKGGMEKRWERGTLAIVKLSVNSFLLTDTNIGLWFHYFKHRESKHTC